MIGGGPAGYVGAIRAAQLGKRVACVERDRTGGTCLNWGCIPTKALLRNAEVYKAAAKNAAEFGLSYDNLSFDWEKVIKRSRDISDRLANGIAFLFKKNKIDLVTGEAVIPAPGKVAVKAADGTETVLEGANIMIATGARSREVPVFPFNGKTIIGSKDALVMPKRPESMIVIGSGARVEKLEDRGDSVTATITTKNGKVEEVTAEVCLVAVGVVPVVPQAEGLQLTERGFVRVDDRYRTNLPGVYAVGDCIGGVMLAHTASFEAEEAVEGMFVEGHTPRHPENVPGCTYCHPQVGSVGKRERQLKEEGVEYTVGKFPFQAIGRAVAGSATEGFVKLIFSKDEHRLIGAHLVGNHATELLTAPELALAHHMTGDEMNAMIYAHPTLAEAIHEAILAAEGRAIHA